LGANGAAAGRDRRRSGAEGIAPTPHQIVDNRRGPGRLRLVAPDLRRQGIEPGEDRPFVVEAEVEGGADVGINVPPSRGGDRLPRLIAGEAFGVDGAVAADDGGEPGRRQVADALPFGEAYGAVARGRLLGVAVWLPPGGYPW